MRLLPAIESDNGGHYYSTCFRACRRNIPDNGGSGE